MNIEDAIRIIKGLDTSNSEENIEAKKMAVKALEKQRQKNSEKKYRHALEPCRDPAESKRTLCCYGRTST